MALAVADGAVARQGTQLLDEMAPRLAGDASTTVAVANRAIGYLVQGGATGATSELPAGAATDGTPVGRPRR